MAHLTTAVILAAGLGTRLASRGELVPKGFLKLGSRPIVEESILRLRAVGCQRIVIVTGHLASYYRDLQSKYSGLIELVHNEHYADSGSMYSLWRARQLVRDDFLLLESDLTYEPCALTECLQSRYADMLLLSTATGVGDEVWVEAEGNRLISMSKNLNDLSAKPIGELVGISRFSTETFQVLLANCPQWFSNSRHIAYETDALVRIAKLRPIHCLVINKLCWSEIDDETQYRRAAEVIYPVIAARDRVFFQNAEDHKTQA